MKNLVKRDVSPEEQREINKKIMNNCMSIAGEDQSKTLKLMGSNERDLDYQQKVELKSHLRKWLQDRFTVKLSLQSGPWENPRSEIDNLNARKGYVKRTLKMLQTISDEK